MRTFETSIEATGRRFGIVAGRFNHIISVRLLSGCTDEFIARGAAPDSIDVAWVPGAFEIPLTLRALARTGRYDALVALGVVIRGGTPHFDFVCNGVTDGVREVMRDTGIPVAFGVLTTDDVDQALDRAGGVEGNKGAEAARVAIEMTALLEQIDGSAERAK